MRPKPILNLLALSIALGVTSNLDGQTPTFQTIDFPGAASTQSWGINSRGDIVGFYTIADKSSHGFLLSEGNYTPIDFPGAAVTLLNGIDDRGNIAGEYGTTLTGTHHGFVLSTGGIFTNIDYPGATFTTAIGVTPSGEIVGYYTLADNVNHSFVLTGGRFTPIDFPGSITDGINGIGPQGDIVGAYKITTAAHGFLLSNGDFTSIDYPAASATIATGTNAAGDIVGRYTDAAAVNHAFLLRGGKLISIDYPGATFTGATAIDASGNIVGRCTVSGLTHGFLMSTPRPSTRYNITDLGPVGGPPGQPYVMADNGLLSGALTAADGTLHAVLWDKGLKIDVGSPGLGGLNSLALAVNTRAQAVGAAETTFADANGEDFCGVKADGFPSQGRSVRTLLLAIRRHDAPAHPRRLQRPGFMDQQSRRNRRDCRELQARPGMPISSEIPVQTGHLGEWPDRGTPDVRFGRERLRFLHQRQRPGCRCIGRLRDLAG